MSLGEPEQLPGGGTTRAAAGLVEGLLRDGATNTAVLLSVILFVAGLVDGAMPWLVVAPVVGVVGTVLSFVSIRRRWPAARTWAVVSSVLVVDGLLLTVIAAT